MPILESHQFESGSWRRDFPLGAWRPTDDPLPQAFLHALSGRILKDRTARTYPDLMTFGYFCRKAQIGRALAGVPDLARRLGWGTVLHIAPANIPINFAFSFAMGLVSGNSNIVRLPSRHTPQMARFIALFDETAAVPEFSDIAAETRFVQTRRDSPMLEALVAEVQGLTVWGGDATVARFRALPKAPRAVTAYFPNRVSTALLSARAVLDAAPEERGRLLRGFFNDSYLMDQNACSSPSLVAWLGSATDRQQAAEVFWSELGALLEADYALDPVARIDRSLDVMRLTERQQAAVQLEQTQNDIWRLDDPALRFSRLRFGTFLEVGVETPAQLASLLRPNEQTLTFYGCRAEEVFVALKTARAAVDRIVPVGRALDIGLYWDGRDMVSLLSRRVELG